jgi:antitoxin VapB
MGLNIKNEEVERLAADVADLAGESKTEAVRRALIERKERLELAGAVPDDETMLALLERDIWSRLPKGVRGVTISKREREEILGYGPEGV